MKKEKPKNLKLLLCALSGSMVIGGCGDVKASKSANKEVKNANRIEKSIENSNESTTLATEVSSEISTEVNTEKQTEKQTEAQTKKLTATGKELHGYCDEEKIGTYGSEISNLITSGKADNETMQSFLVEQVDFIFYGKDICGIYYDPLDPVHKESWIAALGRFANHIESNYPGVVESLPENYIDIIRKVQNNLEYIEEYEKKAVFTKIDESEYEKLVEELKGYADINKEK